MEVKNKVTSKKALSKPAARSRSAAATSISARETQLVIPLGNGWVVKASNKTKFTVITDSKQEAIAIATSIAKSKKADLIIYNKNGSVSNTRSYGVSA